MEEEILDVKRENYKLRKENYELIQDNTRLQEKINNLNYKLREKICFEGHSQFNELKKEIETYKKIAERLAYAIEHNLQGDIITDILCDFTRDNKLCSEKCINCILDWARKEVGEINK